MAEAYVSIDDSCFSNDVTATLPYVSKFKIVA